jgi:type VI secretion system protein VasJ
MTDISFETLGSLPVPGETPAGDDARYESEYAAVLEEIEKLSFSGQGTVISWQSVEKNAVAVLSEKSKDLQIAAYLGVALWQNRGLEGALDGMRVLAGFLETFWETGWPALKRMRGRVNAIDWWHERTYGFLQDAAGKIPPLPVEQRENLLGEIVRLDKLVSSLMPDASPLRDLAAAVRRLPVVQEERPVDEAPLPPATAAQETPEEKAPPAPLSGQIQAPASVPETDDPTILRRHFVAAGQAYIASARRAEPGNPSLWQLSRLIIWGGITALPASESASEKGQTLLPAPDMDVLARARQKLQAGSALDAAFEAEDFFATAPFCLDAQETVHAALAALGPQFAEAARRVMEESARFFSRLPGVEKLSFTDGTPFASPRTAAWLREAAADAAGSGENSPAGDDPCETAFAAARDMMGLNKMGLNKLEAALDILDAAKTTSPAANLRLRAYQTRLLLENGKTIAAQALAEAVLQETITRDLDNWDPSLALEVLVAARDAFVLAESRYDAELREVRRRIARLRPSAVLE